MKHKDSIMHPNSRPEIWIARHLGIYSRKHMHSFSSVQLSIPPSSLLYTFYCVPHRPVFKHPDNLDLVCWVCFTKFGEGDEQWALERFPYCLLSNFSSRQKEERELLFLDYVKSMVAVIGKTVDPVLKAKLEFSKDIVLALLSHVTPV